MTYFASFKFLYLTVVAATTVVTITATVPTIATPRTEWVEGRLSGGKGVSVRGNLTGELFHSMRSHYH